MSDISKCNGVDNGGVICPKRENCYRYTAESDNFWQAWIEAPFTLDPEFKCDIFWGDQSQQIFEQLQRITKGEEK